MTDGAICDLLEHEPLNKELGDKIMDGHCPNCASDKLIRWCPNSGFHDLCTHFHCLDCDADYHWPIAWNPPMPVMKMNGKISPSDRQKIADICEAQNIEVPKWWIPIIKRDTHNKVIKLTLICHECNKHKLTTCIVKSGEWHFSRGKTPRGWVDLDNEIDKYGGHKTYTLFCRCPDCWNKICNEASK